jgi:hypothetical protein
MCLLAFISGLEYRKNYIQKPLKTGFLIVENPGLSGLFRFIRRKWAVIRRKNFYFKCLIINANSKNTTENTVFFTK